MTKYTRLIFFALVLAAVIALCAALYRPKAAKRQFTADSIEVRAADEGIDADTLFEFIYADSGEKYSTTPPSYMYGKDRGFIAAAYPDWNIVRFGSGTVVFSEKKPTEKRYILREDNGYIAVYYAESGKLKEKTSAAVNSLNKDERGKYALGVEVTGDTALQSKLQDLES